MIVQFVLKLQNYFLDLVYLCLLAKLGCLRLNEADLSDEYCLVEYCLVET